MWWSCRRHPSGWPRPGCGGVGCRRPTGPDAPNPCRPPTPRPEPAGQGSVGPRRRPRRPPGHRRPPVPEPARHCRRASSASASPGHRPGPFRFRTACRRRDRPELVRRPHRDPGSTRRWGSRQRRRPLSPCPSPPMSTTRAARPPGSTSPRVSLLRHPSIRPGPRVPRPRDPRRIACSDHDVGRGLSSPRVGRVQGLHTLLP